MAANELRQVGREWRDPLSDKREKRKRIEEIEIRRKKRERKKLNLIDL